MDTVFYEELTPSAFLQRIKQAPIAYLPLGTLEWHGPHLPLGSDGLQSRGLFAQLAQEAGGIVLPMLFVGPDLTRTVDGFTYIGMDSWPSCAAPASALLWPTVTALPPRPLWRAPGNGKKNSAFICAAPGLRTIGSAFRPTMPPPTKPPS